MLHQTLTLVLKIETGKENKNEKENKIKWSSIFVLLILIFYGSVISCNTFIYNLSFIAVLSLCSNHVSNLVFYSKVKRLIVYIKLLPIYSKGY